MQPRLDIIRRKCEKKQKEILALQKFIEEYKNKEGHPHQKNNMDNLNIKSSNNLYASIFQNDFEKNGFVIGEDNNIRLSIAFNKAKDAARVV